MHLYYLESIGKLSVPKRYRAPLKKIYVKIRALYYTGNHFFCPCCNRAFRKFLPFGVKQRQNAQCPGCDSLERHRLLWLYLKHKTNLFTDRLTILHISPESFFQKEFKSMKNINYISSDLTSPIAMVKIDITEIPYKEKSFDVILCCHVLEHISDDRKAMREILRVLKPRGWAILQSPIDPSRKVTLEDQKGMAMEDRERLFGEFDHLRIYGRDYKKRLEVEGFIVKVESFTQEMGVNMVKRYGCQEDEDIYICSKSGFTSNCHIIRNS